MKNAFIVGNEPPYDGKDLDVSRLISEKALIRCHKSGCYYEKELLVEIDEGKWAHRDLVDFNPISGRYE